MFGNALQKLLGMGRQPRQPQQGVPMPRVARTQVHDPQRSYLNMQVNPQHMFANNGSNRNPQQTRFGGDMQGGFAVRPIQRAANPFDYRQLNSRVSNPRSYLNDF